MVWWMWPLGIIERLRAVAPITTLSVDLWDIVGPWCLLLWIPPLLSRTRDLRWWVMTWALTTPYLHISWCFRLKDGDGGYKAAMCLAHYGDRTTPTI